MLRECISHTGFARQLWDMALPDLQEVGHPRATASAVFGNTLGVPAREYGQLLIHICLRGLRVGGAGFFHSLVTSFPYPWFLGNGNDVSR